jgi:dimethylargininase
LFTKAIVRIPAINFSEGLTTVDLGVPDYEQALLQHACYCDALRECGLAVTTLPADPACPDSTFVEDTAVLTERVAVLTRPGAAGRQGEVAGIAPVINGFFSSTVTIEPPGTLDGGDICEAEQHFFIGLSHRTNEEGAAQLTAHLARVGYTASCLDIRAMGSILHLKSGVCYIGDNTLVVMEEMANHEQFRVYDRISIPAEEAYAANCVSVNDHVLVAAGFPNVLVSLSKRGFNPLVLEMSEFRKMDGGLSCLSLRF